MAEAIAQTDNENECVRNEQNNDPRRENEWSSVARVPVQIISQRKTSDAYLDKNMNVIKIKIQLFKIFFIFN